MIGYLSGTARGLDVVMCGGVGYRVSTPHALIDGDEVSLNVVTIVREDAFELYGFPSEAEERLFRALIKASGVGPKLALTLIGSLGGPMIARAIASNDATTLSRCKGVGAKVAQRLCTDVSISEDLLEALGAVPAEGSAAPAEELDDLAAALVALGYAAAESVKAAATARAELPQVNDEGRLIRAALAALAA